MSFVYPEPPPEPTPLRAALVAHYRDDETAAVERTLAIADLPSETLDRIAERARALVVKVRRQRLGKGGLDAFLHEYALSSRRGRGADVPRRGAAAHSRCRDRRPADPRQARRGRLGAASRPQSKSLFVNASTWALMLTGRLVTTRPGEERDLGGVLKRLVARVGRAGDPPGGHRRRCASWAASSSWAAPSTRRSSARGRRRSAAIAIPTTCWARPRAPRPTRERYFERYERGDHRRHRRAAVNGRDVVRGAGHLGQALGAASALRVRPARARAWAS